MAHSSPLGNPSVGTIHSQAHGFTLGTLFNCLRGSEEAFIANSRTADRVEAKDGSLAGIYLRTNAAALKFYPDSTLMPGIDRIQLFCDELGDGGGLTSANVAKVRVKVCRAKPCTLEAANALSLNEVADILEVQAIRESEGKSAMQPQGLRTPAQLLDTFASAAAMFPACPRMVAFLNSANEDGLVRVPSSFLPRNADGQPFVEQLNIGGDSKFNLGHQTTFYGIGGARLVSVGGGLNVGFILHGASNDNAAKKFRDLGNEAGVVVHVNDLVPGIQSYDRPLVLWSLIVYQTLQGSAWLSQIDGVAENPAMHFNPFTASVETLKRLLTSKAKNNPDEVGRQVQSAPRSAAVPTSKRSSERGEGRLKIIGVLNKHHKYDNGSVLHLEPINNNQLARDADVSKSTASEFFKAEFGGYSKYKIVCRHAGRLADSLKALNNEFAPHDLYGRRPPNEDDRGDE